MMSAKERVRRMLDELPDDCSLEDVQDWLYVMGTLERRVEAADRGDFASEEEVERRMGKWLGALGG